MIPERIQRLKHDVMSRSANYELGWQSQHGSWVETPNPWTRDAALDRASASGTSIVQLRGNLLRELVELSEIDIYADWTLAGEHLIHSFGCTQNEPAADTDRLTELRLSEDDIPRLKENHQWAFRQDRLKSVGAPAFDGVDESTNPGGQSVYLAWGWIENHSIRDYPKLLRVGYAGLKAEILAQMDQAGIDNPDYVQKENFWKAGLAVCDAGIRLGERYAALAEAKELHDMAECCRRVPAHGARTFREAVQALWFGHILTCGEDGINANSIGRLDQMLYPYYQADIDSGLITHDDALELMAELACKLYLDYDVQAITLSGSTADGRDCTNELTYIILEATEALGFIRDISIRVHERTPTKLFDVAAGMLSRGGGIPFLFNDNCFIKALTDHGISPEHAHDYAPIGCIELTIPGKANPHAVSGWFSAAKCVELALCNGVDPLSGKQLGPTTGPFSDFASFDDFFAAYKQQVEFFAPRMVYQINRRELAQREGGPLPCWSVLTDDCIQRGHDITDGGPLYNYHSICFLGTANAADSLYALKRLVFEDRAIAPGQILAALERNFDGSESLRQQLLKVEKYGNDCDGVDALAAAVDNHFIDLMDRARSPLNGRYFVHLFSFVLNLGFGAGLGATPDGRKSGEPLAYSLSAQQGRDQEGVTAMLNSLAKLPHSRAAGASAAILDMHPDLVSGPQGVARLSQVLQAAVHLGVGQLQVNVVTEERLRQAKEDPETFGNIPVRVAGFSQLFRLLSPELQDHVIARTKHEC